MNQIFKGNKTEYLIHGLIVISSIAFMNIPQFDLTIGVFNTGDGSFLIPTLYGTVFNAVIFYSNANWLIPTLLRKKKHLKYSIYLISIFIGCSIIETFIDKIVFSGEINFTNWKLIDEIIGLILFAHVLILISSFAYGFFKEWFINERQKQAFKEEKLKSELAFLKSQISPHFLFNTLNNLFSMALKNDDMETAEGIQKLADLLRYMLYTNSQAKIAMQKEIDYLNNYIDLQKLRIKNSEFVTLNIQFPQQVGNRQIAPMLLIPFVENAFKYGISMNQTSQIKIKLEEKENYCLFECANTINKRNYNKEESGIGLENVKRRLQLLYENNHDLSIENNHDEFKVSLKLHFEDEL